MLLVRHVNRAGASADDPGRRERHPRAVALTTGMLLASALALPVLHALTVAGTSMRSQPGHHIAIPGPRLTGGASPSRTRHDRNSTPPPSKRDGDPATGGDGSVPAPADSHEAQSSHDRRRRRRDRQGRRASERRRTRRGSQPVRLPRRPRARVTRNAPPAGTLAADASTKTESGARQAPGSPASGRHGPGSASRRCGAVRENRRPWYAPPTVRIHKSTQAPMSAMYSAATAIRKAMTSVCAARPVVAVTRVPKGKRPMSGELQMEDGRCAEPVLLAVPTSQSTSTQSTPPPARADQPPHPARRTTQ
jgi:hypothetical protein